MRLIMGLLAGLATAGAATGQEAYRIGPGDVLRIEVLEDPTLNRTVLVPPDGRVTLPLAGAVRAGGRSIEQVQADLVAGLTPDFAAPPNVFVSIEQLAPPAETAAAEALDTIDVYVIGAANSPGRLALRPGTNLLQAFAEMGGFSRFAATKRVQLRRVDASGTERVLTVDYEALSRGGTLSALPVLADGDVIVVPERRLFE